MMMMDFHDVLAHRGQGIVPNALPESIYAVGLGWTLKQARANAVAFAAATGRPFKYSFQPGS